MLRRSLSYCAAGALLVAAPGCAPDVSTSPNARATAPLAPDVPPLFNVIDPGSGTVMVCPQGPAGDYSYTVSVAVPADYTIQLAGGSSYSGTLPQWALDAAAANQSLPQGATPTISIPSGNANCVTVFAITGAVNYEVPVFPWPLLDPVRAVTITQTAAPAATQLDSILVTKSGDLADTKYTAPTVTVLVDPNYFHGVVASFWNSHPELAALLLYIDEDGIDNDKRYWLDGGPYTSSAIRSFSTSNVNDDIPHLARRMPLRYFQANPGKTIWLVTGQVGDEGWFAPRTIPSSWVTAGPTGSGLRNFLGNPTLAFPHSVGPGLGTGSNPESRLDKIPNVIPLRAEGLFGLIGRTVCALVWDSDIGMNYGPINASLKGEKLGVAAFEVQDVVYLSGFSSSSLPRVKIRIADAATACGGDLQLYTGAPIPNSSSTPMDIRPNYSADNRGYIY